MAKMLGVAYGVSRGYIIARAESSKPIVGVKVYDKKGRNIGRIYRIFGPVKKPYYAIKPSKSTYKGPLYVKR